MVCSAAQKAFSTLPFQVEWSSSFLTFKRGNKLLITWQRQTKSNPRSPAMACVCSADGARALGGVVV